MVLANLKLQGTSCFSSSALEVARATMLPSTRRWDMVIAPSYSWSKLAIDAFISMHPVVGLLSKHADSSLPLVHSVPTEVALVPSLRPWYQSNLNTLVLFSFGLPVYLDTWVPQCSVGAGYL